MCGKMWTQASNVMQRGTCALSGAELCASMASLKITHNATDSSHH